MKILALPRYTPLGPSSRLRFFQYLPYLNKHNIDVQVEPLFGDDYLNALYIKPVPVLNVVTAYFKRIKNVLTNGSCDIIWIEKELLPWMPSWFEFLILKKNIPLVADYDDAVFHRYDQFSFYPLKKILGKKIDTIMNKATVVVAGNNYIAQRALTAGAKRVEYLPTVVDIDIYKTSNNLNDKVTIGWIGSRSTAPHLRLIQNVIKLLGKEKNLSFVSIGADASQFANLPIETKGWSEQSEVKEIQQFDIGIMPLPDEPFERGKCGYKLIQYMACGKPVIASPVGENTVIVKDGYNGLLASSLTDWEEKLRKLIDDPALRLTMGALGRKIVEERYSLQVAAPKLIKIFNSVL